MYDRVTECFEASYRRVVIWFTDRADMYQNQSYLVCVRGITQHIPHRSWSIHTHTIFFPRRTIPKKYSVALLVSIIGHKNKDLTFDISDIQTLVYRILVRSSSSQFFKNTKLKALPICGGIGICLCIRYTLEIIYSCEKCQDYD